MLDVFLLIDLEKKQPVLDRILAQIFLFCNLAGDESVMTSNLAATYEYSFTPCTLMVNFYSNYKPYVTKSKNT